MSHLICGGVYDWSTGLLYKGGGYFDPRLGIWLLLAPLIVMQGWGKQRRKYPWLTSMLLVVGLGGMLVACQSPAVSTVCVPLDTPTSGAPPERVFEGYHLILACGLGTDCPGEACHSGYQGMVPLQRVRDGFVERGGDYTYLGDGAALSSMNTYAGQIMTELDARTGNKGVFLVGHSFGATAAVWAAGASSHSNLKAIAILDSYLLSGGNDRCKSGEYRGCVADGQRVLAATPMFMGKSGYGGKDAQFPVHIDDVTEYPVDSHEDLAASDEVARLIINFFADNRW